MTDITILDDVVIGYVRKKPGFRRVPVHSRVYYFQGNFYFPLSPTPSEWGRIRGAIRRFKKENSELITAHRACRSYRSIPQLIDEQYGEAA